MKKLNRLLLLVILSESVQAAAFQQEGDVTLGGAPEVVFRGPTDPAGNDNVFESDGGKEGLSSVFDRPREYDPLSASDEKPTGIPSSSARLLRDPLALELDHFDKVQREIAKHRRRQIEGLQQVASEYGLPVRFDPIPDPLRPAVRVTSTFRFLHPAHGFDATDVSLKGAFHPSLGFLALIPLELHHVLDEADNEGHRTSLVTTDFDVSLSQMLKFAQRLSVILGPQYDVVVEDPELGVPTMLQGVEGATWGAGKPMRTDYAFSAGKGGQPQYRPRGGSTGRIIHIQLKKSLRQAWFEALRRAARKTTRVPPPSLLPRATWPEWNDPGPLREKSPRKPTPRPSLPGIDRPDIGPRGDIRGG